MAYLQLAILLAFSALCPLQLTLAKGLRKIAQPADSSTHALGSDSPS